MEEQLDIGKYIAKAKIEELSNQEKVELDNWIQKDEKNKLLYEKLLNDDLIEQRMVKMHQVNVEGELEKTNKLIDRKQKKTRFLNVIKIAASLAIPIIGYFVIQDYVALDEAKFNSEVIMEIEPGSSTAILITGEGKEITLEPNKDKTLNLGDEIVAKNKENKLIYNSVKSKILKFRKEVFNTLRTPIQGEFSLVLADGTNVWLNASSSIKYPLAFIKDQRKVFLTGEAYFEVAENKQKPFIVVLPNGAEVKALGTEFNIMAYEDEVRMETTLVEGSVEVSIKSAQGENEHVILKPSQQLRFDFNSDEFKVNKVDTKLFTSWKNGVFVFERETLDAITRKLERWYGFKTMFVDEEAKNMVFTGEVKKYEDFSKVLEMLQFTEDILIDVQQNEILIKKNNM